jgi:hypothetical protein
MKQIPYIGIALAMVFVSTHITSAMETRTEADKAMQKIAPIQTNFPIQPVDLSQRIFEKQKWDAPRLNLLKEVLKQENIETKDIGTTATIADFSPAIKQFQKKYNILQTGAVGPMTTEKLNTIVRRQIEDPSTQVLPIEKIDFYKILTELPCLNGKKVVTDCTDTKVTPEVLYQKKDAIATWLKSFEEIYRKLRHQNLVSQVNTVREYDQVARETRPVNTPVLVTNERPLKIENTICSQKGPTLDELNQACPLGYNTQKGECNTETTQQANIVSEKSCPLGLNPWKNDCNQAHNPSRNSSNPSDDTPRVMFWCGKVNQYWNLKTHRFETDPDGVTGGMMLDPLSYCKKMYPTLSITQATPYKRELSQNWAQQGNTNNWTSILMSYACK